MIVDLLAECFANSKVNERGRELINRLAQVLSKGGGAIEGGNQRVG